MAEKKTNHKNNKDKAVLVLGIESSCDETAASVVSNNFEILSNVIGSQFEYHQPYGGVVPELAARAHAQTIDVIVSRAITDAGVSYHCLLYTSPSPRDLSTSRMPSSA